MPQMNFLVFHFGPKLTRAAARLLPAGLIDLVGMGVMQAAGESSSACNFFNFLNLVNAVQNSKNIQQLSIYL